MNRTQILPVMALTLLGLMISPAMALNGSLERKMPIKVTVESYAEIEVVDPSIQVIVSDPTDKTATWKGVGRLTILNNAPIDFTVTATGLIGENSGKEFGGSWPGVPPWGVDWGLALYQGHFTDPAELPEEAIGYWNTTEQQMVTGFNSGAHPLTIEAGAVITDGTDWTQLPADSYKGTIFLDITEPN